MTDKIVWLSFDLGVKGDYENLYVWLDRHEARECGDSVAVFNYGFAGADLIAAIKKDLKKNVNLRARDRIYAIFLKDGKMKGTFLFGNRKAAPWSGYGKYVEGGEDDVEELSRKTSKFLEAR